MTITVTYIDSTYHFVAHKVPFTKQTVLEPIPF